MDIPVKAFSIGVLFAAGMVLQGCSDSQEQTEPAALNEYGVEPEGATEDLSSARSSAPADAAVTILSPADGATVTSPVNVEFGLEGMEVVPAGTDEEDTGHHHLLVDKKKLPPMDKPLPSTEQVIHFGGGQTSTELELEPGQHTLQLLLADFKHVPHQPPVISEKITITVE